jgi:hypothetical protein
MERTVKYLFVIHHAYMVIVVHRIPAHVIVMINGMERYVKYLSVMYHA